jgi:hypothetical protein
MGEGSKKQPFYMNAFSGLDSRVNGRDEFGNVKEYGNKEVGKIGITDVFFGKKDRNGPPKTYTIYHKYGKLREKGLGTVPAHEVTGFSISPIKE